jgi:hypothetical protein
MYSTTQLLYHLTHGIVTLGSLARPWVQGCTTGRTRGGRAGRQEHGARVQPASVVGRLSLPLVGSWPWDLGQVGEKI